VLEEIINSGICLFKAKSNCSMCFSRMKFSLVINVMFVY